MDIETKIKNFIDYAREVCLQSLLLADNIKVDLKSQDNLYEVERIDNEVISKYENIYLLLDETTLLDIYKKDAKVFEKIEKAINEHNPDIILSIGQAGGRFDISIERVGINLDDFRIPDNEGNQIIDEPVRAEFRSLSLQFDKYQKELEETENKLSKKWYYEIYGTTDKEILLEAYNTK